MAGFEVTTEAIIDQRVLESLNLFPSYLPDRKRKKYSTEDWTAETYFNEYLPKVKEASERWGCTLRNADRALWGLSVARRIEQIILKSAGERASSSGVVASNLEA